MFAAVHKETGEEVTVYAVEDVPPKQFYHNGYIAFLIYKNNRFTWSDSKYYKPNDTILQGGK